MNTNVTSRKLATVARILLGSIFVVFGLNGFFHFLPQPPAPPRAMAFGGALAATGYFFPLLKATEVTAGALLLAGFVPIALTLLALVCAAPVIASYVAYYWLRPSARVNYGELEATPAPAIVAATADGVPWRLDSLRGHWVLLVVTEGACRVPCERALYATRQARTIQGREQDRIVRVLLQPSGVPRPAESLLAGHPGLTVAAADPRQGDEDPQHQVNPVYGMRTTEPVVFLPSRSRCACTAVAWYSSSSAMNCGSA